MKNVPNANKKEWDTERPPSLDESGYKVWIYAAEVKGYFRGLRTQFYGLLVLLFFLLPWLKIGGRQAFLLDIPNRYFTFFGMPFWAHDAPLLIFVFAFLALTLGFVTAIWGRVWCGWACPQTVFLDFVFRRIEMWLEGTHLQRRALDKAPWTLQKILRKSAKWILFFLISFLLSQLFLSYFMPVEEVLSGVALDPQKSWAAFLFTWIATVLMFINFAWFREQLCLIVCPYGRFQSVLQDPNTVTVMYDAQRGEPRKGSLAYTNENQGDCVACTRCVQVCPTGIDIRNGQQMECVACTACIDACDEIMVKVNKPKGLIRYDSLTQESQLLRPRTLIYLSLIVLSLLALIYNVWLREPLHVQILRNKDVPYSSVRTAEGQTLLLNQFRVHLLNQSNEKIKITFEAPPEWQEKGIQLVTQNGDIEIASGEFKTLPLFITFPEGLVKGTGTTRAQIKVGGENRTFFLVGPK